MSSDWQSMYNTLRAYSSSRQLIEYNNADLENYKIELERVEGVNESYTPKYKSTSIIAKAVNDDVISVDMFLSRLVNASEQEIEILKEYLSDLIFHAKLAIPDLIGNIEQQHKFERDKHKTRIRNIKNRIAHCQQKVDSFENTEKEKNAIIEQVYKMVIESIDIVKNDPNIEKINYKNACIVNAISKQFPRHLKIENSVVTFLDYDMIASRKKYGFECCISILKHTGEVKNEVVR